MIASTKEKAYPYLALYSLVTYNRFIVRFASKDTGVVVHVFNDNRTTLALTGCHGKWNETVFTRGEPYCPKGL